MLGHYDKLKKKMKPLEETEKCLKTGIYNNLFIELMCF